MKRASNQASICAAPAVRVTDFRLRRIFLVVLAAACAREKPRSDTTIVQTEQPASPSDHLNWLITPRGLGPLHAGMTRTEAEAVVGGSFAAVRDTAWKRCAFTSNDHLPPGVRVMVEGGTIARIDVDSGRVATAEGARIGDSEDRIKELYGTRVVVTPRKYTNGHSLTVKPTAAADSLFRIVFEADSGRVMSYRAGRVPPVEYVERCG